MKALSTAGELLVIIIIVGLGFFRLILLDFMLTNLSVLSIFWGGFMD